MTTKKREITKFAESVVMLHLCGINVDKDKNVSDAINRLISNATNNSLSNIKIAIDVSGNTFAQKTKKVSCAILDKINFLQEATK